MKSISSSSISQAVNSGVIKYLNELGKGNGMVHPDVQDRMKELSNELEGMSLRKYKNSLAIELLSSSLIVAAAYGTAYSLRVGTMTQAAIDNGSITSHNWSDGSSLNLIESFGSEWVVGNWHKREASWLQSGNA